MGDTMSTEDARRIAAKPHRRTDAELEQAAKVLGEHGNDESDQHLIDDVWDELNRRADVEPPYDTPSLDLPTYGA